MGFFTRRLTLRDYFLMIWALGFCAVVVCLVLTMHKSAQLESQLQEVRSRSSAEVVEQTGVLDYPEKTATPSGKVTFPLPYDAVPFLTFSVEGGPGFDHLNEELKEFWRKKAAEQADRFQATFVVKAVTPDGFEWESDPRRVGGSVDFSREHRVRWKARGLKLVPHKKKGSG
jgi:hypothetical protein